MTQKQVEVGQCCLCKQWYPEVDAWQHICNACVDKQVMGETTTTIWTCDRCHSKTEVEENLDTLLVPSMPKDWEYVQQHLLCNDCMALFWKILNKFMEMK